MPKKKPEKASTTPAAPKAPAPIPPFFADFAISVLASSTSPRIRVETSAIALCTSVPREGSAGTAVTTVVVVVVRSTDAEWATVCLLSQGGAGQGDPALPTETEWIRGGYADRSTPPPSVLGGGRGQLLLDQVHHRRVGQRGHVAEVAVLGHVPQQPAHDLA